MKRNLKIIKQIAWQKGISIKTLAEKVGLSENGLHRLIRDNNTKMDTIQNIAEILEAPLEYFYDIDSVYFEAKTENIVLTPKSNEFLNKLEDEKQKLLRIIEERDLEILELKYQLKKEEEERRKASGDYFILAEAFYFLFAKESGQQVLKIEDLLNAVINRKEESTVYSDMITWDFISNALAKELAKRKKRNSK